MKKVITNIKIWWMLLFEIKEVWSKDGMKLRYESRFRKWWKSLPLIKFHYKRKEKERLELIFSVIGELTGRDYRSAEERSEEWRRFYETRNIEFTRQESIRQGRLDKYKGLSDDEKFRMLELEDFMNNVIIDK